MLQFSPHMRGDLLSVPLGVMEELELLDQRSKLLVRH